MRNCKKLPSGAVFCYRVGQHDDHPGNKTRPNLLEATVANRIARSEIWINWHPRYDHSFYFVHSHIREHFVFHSEQSAR